MCYFLDLLYVTITENTGVFMSSSQNINCSKAIPNKIYAIEDDRSTFKGLLWALGAFRFGIDAFESADHVLGSISPRGRLFNFSQYYSNPFSALFSLYVFYSLATTCCRNCSYHLGNSAKKIIYIDTRDIESRRSGAGTCGRIRRESQRA